MSSDDYWDVVKNLSDEAKLVSDRGHHEEAAKLYLEVVQLLPPDERKGRILHYLLAASAHSDAQNYVEAIDDCRCAISLDPKFNKSWRMLGSVLLDAGRTAEAEQALLTSINLGITTTACIYLGSVYFDDERWHDAESYFRKAVELAPEFDEAHYNLGSALHAQGRLCEARDALETALKLCPDYNLAHREMGAIRMDEGHLADAEFIYARLSA